MTNQMRMLDIRLDQVRREIEKLRAQEALLLDMKREASGESKVKSRAPRSNVKQAVLNMLDSVGNTGLNASSAVELAGENGLSLERGTVSSLLSRLKNEGIVTYDGNVYRLTKFAEDGTPNVHPLRPSGVGR